MKQGLREPYTDEYAPKMHLCARSGSTDESEVTSEIKEASIKSKFIQTIFELSAQCLLIALDQDSSIVTSLDNKDTFGDQRLCQLGSV